MQYMLLLVPRNDAKGANLAVQWYGTLDQTARLAAQQQQLSAC